MLVSSILAIVLASLEETSLMQSENIQYRMLYEGSVVKPIQNTFYAVSVDSFLDRATIEKLICQIMSRQKPEPYSRLQISIYRQLDEYIPPVGAPSLEAKLREHALAYYTWNVSLPGTRDRLTIIRDKNGNVFKTPVRSQFEHKTECDSAK